MSNCLPVYCIDYDFLAFYIDCLNLCENIKLSFEFLILHNVTTQTAILDYYMDLYVGYISKVDECPIPGITTGQVCLIHSAPK